MGTDSGLDRAARRIGLRLLLATAFLAGGGAAHAQAKVALAAMGDSNTLSYGDRISLPNPEQRGGVYRERTLQWGEIIARLRGEQVDPGPWEVSGVSGSRLRLLDSLGLPVARAPRKEDYRYNFANDGASCSQLMVTRRRQAPRLVALMDTQPQVWRRGAVVLRFGLGELADVADLQVRQPGAPQIRAAVQGCVARIREAVRLIRANHPDAHIVLVGVFDVSQDAAFLHRWQSAAEIERIARLCDDFDDELRAIAASTPRTSFFDDRAWFRQHWGSRDAQGRPDYRTVVMGKLRVTHSNGDAPSHSMLGDDHNGLVWNALWAQAMVQHLRDAAGLPITPIGDEELRRLVDSLAH